MNLSHLLCCLRQDCHNLPQNVPHGGRGGGSLREKVEGRELKVDGWGGMGECRLPIADCRMGMTREIGFW
jgi:hypothetical protein